MSYRRNQQQPAAPPPAYHRPVASDAGSVYAETRQPSQHYAASIMAASSAAGSVAGRSHITNMSRMTQKTFVTASTQRDKRSPLRRNLEAVGHFFYNPETGKVLHRHPLELLRLFVAYVLFYGMIACVFAVCWVVFSYFVINEDTPHLSGAHNALKLSPGLGMRPMPDYLASMIRFRQTQPDSYLIYTTNLQAFVDQYELFYNTERDVSIVDCNIETGVRDSDDPMDSCRFDLEWLGPCSKQAFFGYPRGTPCILMKMNRVYGWLPDIIDPQFSKNVLVQCQGRFDADKENMGTVKYFPSETVNGTEYGILSPLFYPYLTQVGYRSPLVGVQFQNPKRNVAILIECVIFNVRNIKVDEVYREGMLTFEMMVD